VVSLLGLEHMENNITIGFNLESKKLGTKGIIKIADKFFCDEEITEFLSWPSRETEHYS
jgi:aspartate carbamoyltransferase regulatory subunit